MSMGVWQWQQQRLRSMGFYLLRRERKLVVGAMQTDVNGILSVTAAVGEVDGIIFAS